MRAVVVDDSFSPAHMRATEVERPRARPGEVVISVHSAGVNRADLLQVRGQYPSPPDWPHWPGLEVAGEVAEIGEGVTEFRPGDRVCALVGGGGYAEAIAVPADLVLPIPPGGRRPGGSGVHGMVKHRTSSTHSWRHAPRAWRFRWRRDDRDPTWACPRHARCDDRPRARANRALPR